jgi:hypothetical protein
MTSGRSALSIERRPGSAGLIPGMNRPRSIRALLEAVRRLPATTRQSDTLYKSGYSKHRDHWIGFFLQSVSYGPCLRAIPTASPPRLPISMTFFATISAIGSRRSTRSSERNVS